MDKFFDALTIILSENLAVGVLTLLLFGSAFFNIYLLRLFVDVFKDVSTTLSTISKAVNHDEH